jgi:putative colanic acid biosynthesis acetyltransferase WcaF
MIIDGNDPFTEPSFNFSNRLRRAVWGAAYVLLFRYSPRPLHGWRSLLLRSFGAKLGPHVHVYPRARIWAPWMLEIGSHVGIADGVILYNMAHIRIGNHVVISQGAHLCAGSHDIHSRNFQLVARPIAVGDHAWVCAEAFLAPGAIVPEGAVVGARAVVSRPLEEQWAVYAGMPARRINSRTRRGAE